MSISLICRLVPCPMPLPVLCPTAYLNIEAFFLSYIVGQFLSQLIFPVLTQLFPNCFSQFCVHLLSYSTSCHHYPVSAPVLCSLPLPLPSSVICPIPRQLVQSFVPILAYFVFLFPCLNLCPVLCQIFCPVLHSFPCSHICLVC